MSTNLPLGCLSIRISDVPLSEFGIDFLYFSSCKMHEESLFNDFTPLSFFELDGLDDVNIFLLDTLWPLLRLCRWFIADISLDITIVAQWVTYGKPHYYYFWKLCRFIHHHLTKLCTWFQIILVICPI